MVNFFSKLIKSAIIAISIAAIPKLQAYAPLNFSDIVTGTVEKYDCTFPGYNGECKNDVSGVGVVKGFVFTVDDTFTDKLWTFPEGGNPIAVENGGDGFFTSLPQPFFDLEGATQTRDHKLCISSSMTGFDPVTKFDNLNYDRVACFQVDIDTNSNRPQLINMQIQTMRATIMQWLNDTFTPIDPNWFPRITSFAEKNGNLNIEGFTVDAPNSAYDFVWFCRGPLFGTNFAQFTIVKGKKVQILDQGEAIAIHFTNDIFTTSDPYNTPYKIETLNLNGKGARSAEYYNANHGFIISAGPIDKQDGAVYRLWSYQPSKVEGHSTLKDITEKNPDYLKLGRPEGVTVYNETYIGIFSEEDPHFSVQPPIDNIISELVSIGDGTYTDD